MSLKIMYPEALVSVAATAENENFPASNMLDEHPQRVFRSLNTEDTLTCTIEGGSSGIFMFSTNIETGTVTVPDGEGGTEDVSIILRTQATNYAELIQGKGERQKSLWIDYPYQAFAHTITITATAAPPAKLQVGIVRAGLVNSFSDVKLGIANSFKDNSVIKDFNNGSKYVKLITIQDVVKLIFPADIDTEYYKFLFKIAKKQGQKPMPIAWGETIYQEIFGSFHGNLPDAAINNKIRGDISMTIVEAI